jgi:hypothetical protein
MATQGRLLNRLDEIILFRRLQRSDMASIVSVQLDHLRRLLIDRKFAETDGVADPGRWGAGRRYGACVGRNAGPDDQRAIGGSGLSRRVGQPGFRLAYRLPPLGVPSPQLT